MNSDRPSAPATWHTWWHRHERAVTGVYLAAIVLLGAALALGPTRRTLLRTAAQVSDRWDRRWTRRLAHAEALQAAGRSAEAVAWLERLDRVYPAPSPQHGRDQERESLLRMLAAGYESLGRTARTMNAFDRLIAYDPNDYYNVYLKAEAARRLMGGWAVAVEARDAWAAALAIYPNHLPSVRGVIEYHADRGEWRPIVETYRAYLDAFLVHRVQLQFGDTTVAVPVLVDGRPHELEVSVPRPHADTVTIRAAGYIIAVDAAEVSGAQRVGRPGAPAPASIAAAGAATRMAPAAHGAWRPTGDSSAVAFALPAAGASRLRLVLRLYKPVDEALWSVVQQSYRNLLDTGARAEDEARTAPFPTAADADAALRQPAWARAGLGVREDQP